MNKKDKEEIIAGLKKAHPGAKAELNFSNPFELLIATILSAQATDVQVNKVTPGLFSKASNAEKMAKLSIEELENLIRSIGLYKTKGKSILATCKILVKGYGGRVPATLEELISLPGVGRKTANVVLSNAFGVPAIAVDTHVFRVSNRLGLVVAKNVLETERQLMKVIQREDWSLLHHCLIFHGRRVCLARNPKCQECTLKERCKYGKKL